MFITILIAFILCFGSVLVYTILGLTPQANAVYTLSTALGEFFYHTNARTLRWVGYVFQCPEMHRVHHEHGRHRNNYGDIVGYVVRNVRQSEGIERAVRFR